MPAIRPFLHALATTLLLAAWAAPGMAAPVELLLPSHPLESGAFAEITARRTDDQPAIWCWSHLPDGDGELEGGSEQFEASRCTIDYKAPWVAEGIRTITLKVTDLLHPSDRAEGTIQVQARPRVELCASRRQLLSGDSCLLTASEAGVPCFIFPNNLDAFRVLEDRRGRSDWQPVPAGCFRTENQGLRFTAPEVEVPTRVLLDYHREGFVPALLTITIHPRIQIALTEGRRTVLSGRSYRVTATHAQMGCASWIWGTAEWEPTGGSFTQEPGPDGWPVELYHAPETDRPLTVHLTAAPLQDPLTFGTLTLQVLPVAHPKGPMDQIFDQLVPAVAGHGWMDPRPEVGWFALPSSPQAFWRGAQEPNLRWVKALAFVDAPGAQGPFDPVRGDRIPLHGHWLVAVQNGLWVLPAARGEVPRRVPLPLGGEQVQAMVTRRPGEDRSNPFVAVFALACEQDLVSTDFDDEDGEAGGDFLVALLPDGSWRLLAGEPKVRACPSQLSYPPARFRNVVDLAMDEGGTVFAADQGLGGRIWQVQPTGLVSSLAGGSESDPMPWDGTGPDASMTDIRALAYDPSRRVLFAADAHGLRQVTRQGQVTTLQEANGWTDFRLRVHGERLFHIQRLAAPRHTWRLAAFDLRDHTSITLLEQQQESPFRLGPIHAFSPDLPPEACASVAVGPFGTLAITAHGTCLVSLDQNANAPVRGILQVDLGPLAEPPPAPAAPHPAKRAREHPERDEERKEPHPDRPVKNLKLTPSNPGKPQTDQ